MGSQLIKSDIKLTIGILVSNHVQYIRKVMEGIKPLLDAVPSELVVIDTKGNETDGSIEIVREYTDRIYPFTWCNDFSAARNFCLDHAKGEWFLYQDDDEWFDDVQEFIDFFKNGDCEKYYSGYYYTKDYHADGSFSMGIAGRMVRRTVETRFVGKVHETFNQVYAPNKQFSCFTHHMGYAYSTQEDRKRHQDRNLSILREELKEYGYTPRICAQMTQELMYVEDTVKEGLEFAKKCILELEKTGQLEDSCSQWVLTSTVRVCRKTGSYEDVLNQAKELRSKYPLSRMAGLVISSIVAKAAGENGDLDTLIENVNSYIIAWDWLQANKEEALLQTQMDFPRYFSETNYFSLLQGAAVAQNHKGNYPEAEKYWNRIPWDRDGFDGNAYYADLQVTYEGLKKIRQKKGKEESMDKQGIKEIYGLLDTISEALVYLQDNADDMVQKDISESRVQITDFIEKSVNVPIRAWIDADALSDIDWLNEMYRVLDELENPLLIRNKYDREFMLLIKYMRMNTAEYMLDQMKNRLEELKAQDAETYDKFSGYFNKFPFWGSFDPEQGDFTTLELRAKALKQRNFEFVWLYKRLEDYISKRTLLAILSNWALFDMKEPFLMRSVFMDYFEPDIFPDNVGDVFVDAGAYIGDSIWDYVKMYGENYKKIYAYEISEETCKVLAENTKKLKNIVIRQKGLGSGSGYMNIIDNPNSSSANQVEMAETEKTESEKAVEIVALDDDITEDKVTFIKMDIEGAEQGALQGCMRIIREQHPKLAVCIYHGYEALWEIPTMIDEAYPGYKFYIRHNGGNVIPTEFVLLCK